MIPEEKEEEVRVEDDKKVEEVVEVAKQTEKKVKDKKKHVKIEEAVEEKKIENTVENNVDVDDETGWFSLTRKFIFAYTLFTPVQCKYYVGIEFFVCLGFLSVISPLYVKNYYRYMSL